MLSQVVKRGGVDKVLGGDSVVIEGRSKWLGRMTHLSFFLQVLFPPLHFFISYFPTIPPLPQIPSHGHITRDPFSDTWVMGTGSLSNPMASSVTTTSL